MTTKTHCACGAAPTPAQVDGVCPLCRAEAMRAPAPTPCVCQALVAAAQRVVDGDRAVHAGEWEAGVDRAHALQALSTLLQSLPPVGPPCVTEVARLKDLLQRDRTGLAGALAQVRRIVGDSASPYVGYSWIPAGEWGCYEEHEQTEANLRAEVGRCFDEIAAVAEQGLRESGTRVNAAFHPDRTRTTKIETERDALRPALERLVGCVTPKDPAFGFRDRDTREAVQQALLALELTKEPS